MSNILYKVQTNLYLLSIGTPIEEISYTKKTEHFYYDSDNNRNQLDTTWSKCFDTKQEAIDYLKSRIDDSIKKAEADLNYAISHLDSFNKLYNK